MAYLYMFVQVRWQLADTFFGFSAHNEQVNLHSFSMTVTLVNKGFKCGKGTI